MSGGLFVRSFAHHGSCFVCLKPLIAFSGFVQGDRLTVLARLPLAREFLKRTNCGYCFPFQNSLALTNFLHSFLQTSLLSVNFKIMLSSISTFVSTTEERPLSSPRSKRTHSSSKVVKVCTTNPPSPHHSCAHCHHTKCALPPHQVHTTTAPSLHHHHTKSAPQLCAPPPHQVRTATAPSAHHHRTK